MLYWLIPLIIGAVLFIVFLYFRVKEERIKAVYIKGLVSLMFIATALVAWLTGSGSHNTFGVFVLIGLLFGLVGDVLLDLKYIVSKEKEMTYTVLGFFAFFFGHVFYSLGLFLKFYSFESNIMYLIVPLIVTAILTAITLLMEKFSEIRYQRMKPYVLVYGLALFFTTSIYMSVAIQTRFSFAPIAIMAISLLLFMLSDLILNNTYFAPGFSKPVFIITNHALYYIAQFAIAVSLFYLI